MHEPSDEWWDMIMTLCALGLLLAACVSAMIFQMQ